MQNLVQSNDHVGHWNASNAWTLNGVRASMSASHPVEVHPPILFAILRAFLVLFSPCVGYFNNFDSSYGGFFSPCG